MSDRDLEHIRGILGRIAKDPERAREIVCLLAATDWDLVIKGEQARLRAKIERADSISKPCARCGDIFPLRELDCLQDLPSPHLFFCASCSQKVRKQYERECALCGTIYVARTASAAVCLCRGCRTPYLTAEWKRVHDNNRRAVGAGFEGSLTLTQWLATIEHFNGLCAYCQDAPYTDMDHFRPLSLGGGTTATNCVPACRGCNMLKGRADPTLLLFESPYERVKTYLDQKTEDRHCLTNRPQDRY
jgi:5-methylcytosine-specific restriction endonuclease McrA